MNAEIEKFTKLQDNLRYLENRKIRLEEQYRTKKEDIKKLVVKIRESGFDPNSLNETIAKKEAELKNLIEDFEKKIQEASTKLDSIEV